jgi:hypothetical protein
MSGSCRERRRGRRERLQAAVSEAEVVDAARRLVQMPSVTGDEARVVEVARRWLEAPGVESRIVGRLPERPNLVLEAGRDRGPVFLLNRPRRHGPGQPREVSFELRPVIGPDRREE